MRTRHQTPGAKAGTKPILTDCVGARGQADLIDYQGSRGDDFNFLLVYVDHFSKFAFAEPLQNKRRETVLYALARIFSFIGPPAILQTDNGREFSRAAASSSSSSSSDGGDDIVAADGGMTLEFPDIAEAGEGVDFPKMWPGTKQVRGRARHSESNGGVERVNRELRKLISTAQAQYNIAWRDAVFRALWTYNTVRHHRQNNTPFKIILGHDPVRDMAGCVELIHSQAANNDNNDENDNGGDNNANGNDNENEIEDGGGANENDGGDGEDDNLNLNDGGDGDGNDNGNDNPLHPNKRKRGGNDDDEANGPALSPNRGSIREQVRVRQGKNATAMRARVSRGLPALSQGDVVNLNVPQLDATLSQGSTLTCAVVEVSSGGDQVRLVCAAGTLTGMYFTMYMSRAPGESTLALCGLKAVYDQFLAGGHGLRTLTLRAAFHDAGIDTMRISCGCRGPCKGRRCKCVSSPARRTQTYTAHTNHTHTHTQPAQGREVLQQQVPWGKPRQLRKPRGIEE
jgi:hypothetical protein